MNINVATYNFCQGGFNDYSAMHMVLNELKADILFAQEILHPDLYVNEGELTWKKLRFACPLWQEAPSFNQSQSTNEQKTKPRWGSAVFIKQGSLVPIDVPESFSGWVVGAIAAAPFIEEVFGAPIKLFSVHTPTVEPNNYPEQLMHVCKFLKDHVADENAIVAGDFNITISDSTHSDFNSDDPTAREVRNYMSSTLKLTNCWRAMNPDARLEYTFQRYKSRNHLDAIFISNRLAGHLQSCRILHKDNLANPKWQLGDHWPVVACFK